MRKLYLLQQYVDSHDQDDGNVDFIKEFFADMLHSFGRSALVMHGGASFGLCHLGVAKALFEWNRLPDIICGSHIGALAAAMICVHTNSELSKIFEGDVDFSSFVLQGRASGGWRRKFFRLIYQHHLFDIGIIQDAARKNFGELTFYEAYQRTGRILNITVKMGRPGELPVLLNYLTSPDVLIWSAACASCATPGVYSCTSLLAKDKNGENYCWQTASILRSDCATVKDEVAFSRLTELFNVTNFIVSQVPSYFSVRTFGSDGDHYGVIGWVARLILSELSHRFYQAEHLGLVPSWILSLHRFFSVPDVGDIRISPIIFFLDFRHIIRNPDKSFLQYCLQKGQQAAWKQYSLISTRCDIEFSLASLLEESMSHKISSEDFIRSKEAIAPHRRVSRI